LLTRPGILSQYDSQDSTSISDATRKRLATISRTQTTKRPLRIGIPTDYNVTELDPRILAAWKAVFSTLQHAGHTIQPVSLSSTKLALSAYYILAPAEASSNLAKYDGVRYGTRTPGPDAEGGVLYSETRSKGFGGEVKRRILLGSYTLSSEAMDSYFVKAQKIRRLVQQDFDAVFAAPNALHDSKSAVEDDADRVDVLICPTASSLPPKISKVKSLDPVQNYVTDVFTVPASLAGLPALSVPLALVDEQGPGGNIGMQIIGQYGMDDTVLQVGQLFEDLGMTKKPIHSALESRELTKEDEASLTWPREFAEAYVNMSRYYGGGMAAIHHKLYIKKSLPPVR
jgi:aspartyl-tRNA(Asn)/glutamyl-tRNA(Gln) amidotransferase subunit A